MLNKHTRLRSRTRTAAGLATLLLAATVPAADNGSLNLDAWPTRAARPADPALEARIETILASMTLRDKVGQMTQSDIQTTTPDDVRRYRLGSVLNGGGSWPNGKLRSTVQDWLALSQAYYDASMASGALVPIPVFWGTDAVHGHNNVFGATLFPHNLGLGAARDPELVAEIGRAVGRAVRATGIQWAFAPTLAVARDSRWGRSYESFGDDPALVADYASRYVSGLQGTLQGDGDVLATAKHYVGDGATARGLDQGVAEVTLRDLVDVHARGYYAALDADVQTVMVSYSSWTDAGTGVAHGKMHGNRWLITDVLKGRLGFDGLVVSDWDAIEQVPGCTKSSCPAAVNAGIDLFMVPAEWKAFIDNTVAQVERGEIAQARIDDAVRRILRVKLRAGLFERPPQRGRYAGDSSAIVARDLARRAVRESLVLLKNDAGVLPLRRGSRVLVVGSRADDVPAQAGGWSLTWQGDKTSNADYPNADSVLAAVRAAAGGQVVYAPRAKRVDPAKFDVVVAVVGETPYAEMKGDVLYPAPLSASARSHRNDLRTLQAVHGHGVPVVTILLAGRALYATDLIAASDAFVMAWLPGTEGKGITDVVFRSEDGTVAHDFRGRLPVSWPRTPCQTKHPPGDGSAPLFPSGYGLDYSRTTTLGPLELPRNAADCSAAPVATSR